MYYTKYRPQKFSEIAPPNQTADALAEQLKAGKTVHAYLFVGPRGTGKTTLARILAKALNCEKLTKTGDPCGKCPTCVAIQKNKFMDLYEIDAASNRGIDDIRLLKERVGLAPSKGKMKVYIIDEVHMLTNEAFNALLKTLEEPPAHVVFILCTTEVHKVPDTVKSRCHVFKIRRASIDQLVTKLQAICTQEHVTRLTKADLTKIARAAYGGFRDAETILQQVVEANLKPEEFVGLSSKQHYIDFVSFLITQDTKSLFESITNLEATGLDPSVWLLDLIYYLRQLVFVKSGSAHMLADMPEDLVQELTKQADQLSFSQLVTYLESFSHANAKLSEYPSEALALEIAVLKSISADRAGSVPLVDNSTKDVPPVSGAPRTGSKEKTTPQGSQVSAQLLSDENTLLMDSAVVLIDSEPEVTDFPKQMLMEQPQVVPAVIPYDSVVANWAEIIKRITLVNSSIYALLKASRPAKIVEATLYLDVCYKFHKERLETAKNRQLVETAIFEVLGVNLAVVCVVNDEIRPVARKNEHESGDLTDLNISPPVYMGVAVAAAAAPGTSKPFTPGPIGLDLSVENMAQIFDGGLPL